MMIVYFSILNELPLIQLERCTGCARCCVQSLRLNLYALFLVPQNFLLLSFCPATQSLSPKSWLFSENTGVWLFLNRVAGKIPKILLPFSAQVESTARLELWRSGHAFLATWRLGDSRVRHDTDGGCRCVNNNNKKECQKCRVICVW